VGLPTASVFIFNTVISCLGLVLVLFFLYRVVIHTIQHKKRSFVILLSFGKDKNTIAKILVSIECIILILVLFCTVLLYRILLLQEWVRECVGIIFMFGLFLISGLLGIVLLIVNVQLNKKLIEGLDVNDLLFEKE
jgi:hypothetical protein